MGSRKQFVDPGQLNFRLFGLGQPPSGKSGSRKFSSKIAIFLNIYPLGLKKYFQVESKNTLVKAGLAPFLLRVSSIPWSGPVTAHL